jgi:hypothetical protein
MSRKRHGLTSERVIAKLKTLLENQSADLRTIAIEGFSKLFFLKVLDDSEVNDIIFHQMCVSQMIFTHVP